MTGKTSRKGFRIVIMFVLWISAYTLAVLGGDTIFNNFNIFILMRKIDVRELVRYGLMILFVVVICAQIYYAKRKEIGSWLE